MKKWPSFFWAAAGILFGGLLFLIPRDVPQSGAISTQISPAAGTLIDTPGGNSMEFSYAQEAQTLLLSGEPLPAIRKRLEEFCAKWIEKEPVACAEWLVHCPPDFRDKELVWAAIASAAKKDPEAILQIVKDAPGNSMRLNGLSNILRSVEPDAAVRLWNTLTHIFDEFGLEQEHREHLTSQMLGSLADSDPLAALSQLDQTPYLRGSAIHLKTKADIIASWLSKDYASAKNWLAELEIRQRSALGSEILTAISKSDPALAVEIAEFVPPGLEKTKAISQVLGDYFRKDPQVALEYIENAPHNASWLPDARRTVAHEALKSGDMDATEKLVSTIINPRERIDLWNSLSFSIAINDPLKAWAIAEQVWDESGALSLRRSAIRFLAEESPAEAIALTSKLAETTERARAYDTLLQTVGSISDIDMSKLDLPVVQEITRVWQRRQQLNPDGVE